MNALKSGRAPATGWLGVTLTSRPGRAEESGAHGPVVRSDTQPGKARATGHGASSPDLLDGAGSRDKVRGVACGWRTESVGAPRFRGDPARLLRLSAPGMGKGFHFEFIPFIDLFMVNSGVY